MEDNTQKGWQPQQPSNFSSMPENRPAPPPPPPPEIAVRTMKSDIESLKETGGANIAPKPFTPPELKKEWNPPAPPPPPPKIAPSEFGAPKKTGTSPAPEKSTTVIEEEPKSGKLKKIILWGGLLIAIIAIALAGYFIIFPYLFPEQVSPPPPAITPPATETETPIIPEAEVPEVEMPAILPHQSLLLAPDKTSQISLASIDLASVLNALTQESKNIISNGTLKEVVLNDANGQIPASSVLSAIIPEFSSEKIKEFFEDDFTMALYYDENGVWPAYIFKLKIDSNVADAQNLMKGMETSANLANLFLVPPGIQATSEFKIGQANGIATSYLAFSKKGAALNLAWKNDIYIISASYNGIKKVLNNL